jgi:hypothetical protein
LQGLEVPEVVEAFGSDKHVESSDGEAEKQGENEEGQSGGPGGLGRPVTGRRLAGERGVVVGKVLVIVDADRARCFEEPGFLGGVNLQEPAVNDQEALGVGVAAETGVVAAFQGGNFVGPDACGMGDLLNGEASGESSFGQAAADGILHTKKAVSGRKCGFGCRAIAWSGVKVAQDFTGFCAFARSDVTAGLEDVEDPGSAGVAEAEPALEEGGGGFFLLTHDFDAFFDEFLVFVGEFLLLGAGVGLEALMDGVFEGGFALSGGVVDDALDFFVGDQHALGAEEFGGAWGTVEEVALAKEPVGTVLVQDDP